MKRVFETQFRVYHEDTDAGGIVYHPNYLSFMSRARAEWLRSVPGFWEDLRNKKILTPVKSAGLEFFAPAFLDDEILVITHLRAFKPVSALFFQEVYRYNTDTLLCSAHIKLACVDGKTLKIHRWPRYKEMQELLR